MYCMIKDYYNPFLKKWGLYWICPVLQSFCGGHSIIFSIVVASTGNRTSWTSAGHQSTVCQLGAPRNQPWNWPMSPIIVRSSDEIRGVIEKLFLFLIQRKVRILSKFCDVYIEIKYISSNWMLLEKQLWRHSPWHVTSRDISKGVIVVNRFSRVASAKFEKFFRSKKHSIPLRKAHLKLIATYPNTIRPIYSHRINCWNMYSFSNFFNFKIDLHISLCY